MGSALAVKDTARGVTTTKSGTYVCIITIKGISKIKSLVNSSAEINIIKYT